MRISYKRRSAATRKSSSRTLRRKFAQGSTEKKQCNGSSIVSGLLLRVRRRSEGHEQQRFLQAIRRCSGRSDDPFSMQLKNETMNAQEPGFEGMVVDGEMISGRSVARSAR